MANGTCATGTGNLGGGDRPFLAGLALRRLSFEFGRTALTRRAGRIASDRASNAARRFDRRFGCKSARPTPAHLTADLAPTTANSIHSGPEPARLTTAHVTADFSPTTADANRSGRP